jgi:hypothetical protein
MSPDVLRNLDEYTAFFDSVLAAYKKAENSAGGAMERYYRIGEQVFQLRFAGEGLIPQISPAIEHLETEEVASPGLRIHVFDSVSTGLEMPSPLEHYLNQLRWYHTNYLSSRFEVKEFCNERFLTVFHWGPHILSILDRQENLACYWIEDAALVPFYERSLPLRPILNGWFTGQGYQFIHGAAVGYPQGGVILTGKSGAGKSTTSLACLDSDLKYASDDYCLVKAGPTPTIYSVYNVAKLKGRGDMDRFPKLAPLISNPDRLDTEWGMLFINEHYPGKMLTGFPLKAILIPKVSGKRETSLIPISPRETFAAMAPTTVLQLPGSGSAAMKSMSELAQRIPCYRLVLGTEIEAIPSVISDLLLKDSNSRETT